MARGLEKDLTTDRPGRRLTAALLLLSWSGATVGIALLLTGGISFRIGDLAVRAHSATQAFGVSLVCLAAAWRRGTAHLGDTLIGCWTALERWSAAMAVATAGVAIGIGLVWGSYVAGGSDSYCYLNQAEMLASGQLRQHQPIVQRAPWPNAARTFAPVGHLPAAGAEPAIVPACPVGYPLLMAAARRLAGRPAMFWVVPLMGGLAVWLTFALGRRVAGSIAGLAAAALLAFSPTFLYQITQPMTDIPALALWTTALLVAARRPGSMRGALLAGFVSGGALAVRPNLVPLVIVVAGAVLVVKPFSMRATVRTLAAFALAVLPFIIGIVLVNRAMHGGALESGYGRLRDLFTLEHVAGNLQRYPLWLLETQTPFVLLALAAPWTERRTGQGRVAWWLLAFALMTFACYLPYTVWDAWWFLRFVLPAFPPLLVLSAAVATAGLSRMPAAFRTVAFAGMMSLLIVFQLATAADRAVFRLRDLEARFRDAGEYVDRRLPPNAIVFADTESGSVRFYSGRQTLVWSRLDPDWLDRAIDFLKSEGYRPYFLFEPDEELLFKQRFGRASRLGALEWPPAANINRQVRIYDPDDYAVYARGGNVATDYVWTTRPY